MHGCTDGCRGGNEWGEDEECGDVDERDEVNKDEIEMADEVLGVGAFAEVRMAWWRRYHTTPRPFQMPIPNAFACFGLSFGSHAQHLYNM